MKEIRFKDGRTFKEYDHTELAAYVGDVHAFDLDTIENEATSIIISGGRPVRVWAVDGDKLATICANSRVYGWTCPDDGARLEEDGDGWRCPHCECYTSSPAQDACTPLYSPVDASPLRFSGSYEDVFVEDEHFLYACTEPGAYGYGYACNEYRVPGRAASSLLAMKNRDAGSWGWIRGDACETSGDYLRTLRHAPLDIARTVIMCETRRALEFEDMDEEERAAYMEYTADRLEMEFAALA